MPYTKVAMVRESERSFAYLCVTYVLCMGIRVYTALHMGRILHDFSLWAYFPYKLCKSVVGAIWQFSKGMC